MRMFHALPPSVYEFTGKCGSFEKNVSPQFLCTTRLESAQCMHLQSKSAVTAALLRVKVRLTG